MLMEVGVMWWSTSRLCGATSRWSTWRYRMLEAWHPLWRLWHDEDMPKSISPILEYVGVVGEVFIKHVRASTIKKGVLTWGSQHRHHLSQVECSRQRRHDIGYYLWLSYLWGEICIGTSLYSHAQGMIVNTKLNPYNVMSLCFANEFVMYISCHTYLWHPLPICVFLFILICTHLGGGAIFLHDMIYLFANPSVVI